MGNYKHPIISINSRSRTLKKDLTNYFSDQKKNGVNLIFVIFNEKEEDVRSKFFSFFEHEVSDSILNNL